MSQDDFKKINELIRQGGRKFDDWEKFPSDDDIYACLENTATNKQLESIQKALLNSVKFRYKFKKVSREYQEFINQGNNRQYNSETILPEKLRNVLKNEFSKYNDENNSISKKIKDFFNPLQVALGSLVVVASTIILMLLNASNPVLIQMAKQNNVEKSDLVSMITRGVAIDSSFNTGRDAALFGFRQYMKYDYDNDVFLPRKDNNLTFWENWFNEAVDLVDSNGNSLGTIQINNKIEENRDVTEIQIRLIDINTFDIYYSDLKDLKHPLQFNLKSNKTHFIVITFKLHNMYYVAGGAII